MAKKCFRCRGAITFVLLPRYPITTARDEVVLILDLPAQRCTQCGQLFFTSGVTEILDALRRGETEAQRRRVVLATYKMPAHLREATRSFHQATQEPQELMAHKETPPAP
jgi:YgiT-type zinc finger domain-containing protein